MRATALATALALATLASAGCPSAPAPRPPGGDGEAQRHGAKKPRPTPVEAAFTVSFEADPDEDPIGLEGATDLLVELLATEGQERAAAYGATLEAFREAGRAGWRIRGPDAAFEQMAAIVLDLALDPRLSGTELATRTERWRERLRVRPDAVVEAARRWAAALATGHGRPVGLEPSDNALATVNREDLVRLHRRLVRPERWTISASHPLGPELTQRLADAAPSARPSAPGDAPRPCLAPIGSSFRLAGPNAATVVATVAPAPEREAWSAALAALERYPSLQAAARVERRGLGADVVVVMTLAHDADPAAAWSAIIARLGALAPAPLPADLITPAAWITVAVGAAGNAPGPELSRDNASCRR